MRKYIVRLLRREWFRTDYVGTYLAANPIDAMRQAAADSYCKEIADSKVIAFSAVLA